MKKHLTILTTLLLGATLVTPVVSLAASSVYKRFVDTDEEKFIDHYDITILTDSTQVMFDILAYDVRAGYFSSDETTYIPDPTSTDTENLLNTEMFLLEELSDGTYQHLTNNDNVWSQSDKPTQIGDRGNDGSVSDLDAWLYPTLNTGNYVLAVSTWNFNTNDVVNKEDGSLGMQNNNFKDLNHDSDLGSKLLAWYQLTVTVTEHPSAVPLPAAIWLMGSGLIGLFGLSRRKTAVTV